MKTDVAVIGAGLSGLTAASLLAHKGLSVALIERHYQPGGSCGAFRRDKRTFDHGTTILHGFGEYGFNPHRYVMDQLSEPITLIKHEDLYQLTYDGIPILFSSDIESYFTQLERLFPEEIEGIKAFYAYIGDLYHQGILSSTGCVTPLDLTRKEVLGNLIRHPIKQIQLLRLFGKSAEDILKRFISSERVIRFFNRLTATYSDSNLKETPALLAITMFMDNHFGGSYYPLGSSIQLPGKLEKAFEQAGGTTLYQSTVHQIEFINNRPCALTLHTHTGEELTIETDDIIYSGALHNFYHHLLPEAFRQVSILDWIDSLEMTYPSVILYCAVRRSVIPEGAQPIERYVDNPEDHGENALSVYRLSLSDPSICPPDEHLVMAIGPSIRPWPTLEDSSYDSDAYLNQKEEETQRILQIIEKHMPGFREGLKYHTLATPTTIEYYTMKNGGVVAGPKQTMGQDLHKRNHASTAWENLFLCGEGTVRGTGSPAVTSSGINAANMVLRRRMMKEYTPNQEGGSIVQIVRAEDLSTYTSEEGDPVIRPNMIKDKKELILHDIATYCQWCADDTCRNRCPHHLDIRGLMRRLECGNIVGAKKIIGDLKDPPCMTCSAPCEDQCLHTLIDGKSVKISEAIRLLCS